MVAARAGIVGSIDSSVNDFFVDHRPEWLVNVSKFFDTYGSSEMLIGVALLVALVWLVRTRPSLLPLAIPVSLCVNAVVVAVLKDVVARGRPEMSQRLVEATSASLPSGHSASAAALVASIVTVRSLLPRGARQRTAVDIALIVFAFVAGVARLVLGVHWLSDVVVGWFIGAIIGVVITRLATKILPCRPSTN
jgi:membrane-associated phospholipid phosphatase